MKLGQTATITANCTLNNVDYCTITGGTANLYNYNTSTVPMNFSTEPIALHYYKNSEDMKNFEKVEKVVPKKDKLDPRLVKVNKEIEELRKKTKFYYIKEYVPEKVYGFTFKNDKKHEYKTICSEEDPFDLTFAFALAYAKQDAGKILTINGIIQRAHDFFDFKDKVKEFKNGIKLFHKLQEKEALEEQIKFEKKHRHAKLVAKKIAKKQSKKEEQYEIIKSAIKDSKL